MATKLSISLNDYIVDQIVEANRPTNTSRSEWIEQLILRGWEEKQRMRMAGFEHPTSSLSHGNNTSFINPVVPDGFIAAGFADEAANAEARG